MCYAIIKCVDIDKQRLVLMVGEYRKQGFVGSPFRDSARGITRSEIFPGGSGETVVF